MKYKPKKNRQYRYSQLDDSDDIGVDKKIVHRRERRVFTPSNIKRAWTEIEERRRADEIEERRKQDLEDAPYLDEMEREQNY